MLGKRRKSDIQNSFEQIDINIAKIGAFTNTYTMTFLIKNHPQCGYNGWVCKKYKIRHHFTVMHLK